MSPTGSLWTPLRIDIEVNVIVDFQEDQGPAYGGWGVTSFPAALFLSGSQQVPASFRPMTNLCWTFGCRWYFLEP